MGLRHPSRLHVFHLVRQPADPLLVRLFPVVVLLFQLQRAVLILAEIKTDTSFSFCIISILRYHFLNANYAYYKL